jgi:hypothetical protein
MLPRLCPKCGLTWVIQQFRWQKDGQHDWLGEHLVSEATYWAGQLSMRGCGGAGPLMIVSQYSRRISRGVMMPSWERWV